MTSKQLAVLGTIAKDQLAKSALDFDSDAEGRSSLGIYFFCIFLGSASDSFIFA